MRTAARPVSFPQHPGKRIALLITVAQSILRCNTYHDQIGQGAVNAQPMPSWFRKRRAFASDRERNACLSHIRERC